MKDVNITALSIIQLRFPVNIICTLDFKALLNLATVSSIAYWDHHLHLQKETAFVFSLSFYNSIQAFMQLEIIVLYSCTSDNELNILHTPNR